MADLAGRPAGYSGPPAETPLVSCLLLPTGSVEQLAAALTAYRAQDYPARELVLAVPPDAAHRLQIAGRDVVLRPWPATHDELAAAAHGSVLALWDDTARYPWWRLSVQVARLLRTGVEVSGTSSPPAGLVDATVCVTARSWREYPFAAGADSLPARSWQPPAGPVDCCDDLPLCELTGSERPMLVPLPVQPVATPTLTHVDPATPAPLVSCVMPTHNRRRFVPQALRHFLAQDWPRRELLVVDDGADPVADLVPDDPRIRYVRLDRRRTIGAKRNLACELAAGDIVVQWDDDDWYGAGRLSYQVAEIVSGRAELTGIVIGLLLDLRSGRYWALPSRITGSRPPAVADIAAGTLAFTRDVWRRSGGYPDASLGEDVGLMSAVADVGGRITATANRLTYVYVRHAGNSWRFPFDPATGPPGWTEVDPSAFLPAADLAFHAEVSRETKACLVPAGDRRAVAW